MLPFELRPTNKIRLDYEGNVVQCVLGVDADTNAADAYAAGVPMQRAWLQLGLSIEHCMTGRQMATFRNQNGKSTKYDIISIFSLWPPELLSVFRNPVEYFRYCYIDEEQVLNEETVENMLSDNLR